MVILSYCTYLFNSWSFLKNHEICVVLLIISLETHSSLFVYYYGLVKSKSGGSRANVFNYSRQVALKSKTINDQTQLVLEKNINFLRDCILNIKIETINLFDRLEIGY